MKEEAATTGKARAFIENPKYFYGYSFGPGIKIQKIMGVLTLHLRYQVCQGGYDALLFWPLQKILVMNVLNAEGKEIPECTKVNTRAFVMQEHERPKTTRNNALLSRLSIKVNDVEKKDCAKNKLSVKFTLS